MASSGRDADACSDDFARGTVDPERSDLFSKIRKDFDAAGVAQSDEQILRIMTKLMLKGGGNFMPTTLRGSRDAAAVMLTRDLPSR